MLEAPLRPGPPSVEPPMTPPTLPPFRPARIVPAAMTASVALVCLAAVLLARQPAAPFPELGVWLLATMGFGLVGGGALLRVVADRSSASGAESMLAPRRLGSLALMEAGGVIGAVLSLLTGSPLWAATLGAAAVAGLLVAFIRA